MTVQNRSEDHVESDDQDGLGELHNAVDTQRQYDAADPFSALLFAADFLDDMERVRIATENRLRALDQGKDHEHPGPSLRGTPWYDAQQAQLDNLKAIEKQAVLALEKTVRAHPLGPWIKRTTGVGEKQGARLLAAIGDPADRPNPAKLWAYCGFHVIEGKRPRHVRGQQSNWSNTAKMRARLIAESCIKQKNSPYRPVYDRERAKWADRETSDLHKHNHALAVVAKAILKDLWREARALQGHDVSHPEVEA